MPATASGVARAEEAASAPSDSSSAPFCMVTRPEELAARLAAGAPGGVGGPGGGGGRGEGGEGEHERVLALREIKNQIIGNRTKKLLYLRLGAVPTVVAALAEPRASPAALVQAAAAAGSFACGVDDGARAVLAAGAMEHLTRLLAHPDDKVCTGDPIGLLRTENFLFSEYYFEVYTWQLEAPLEKPDIK